ncbi:MAG: LacI family DNA-binding transcriptional regulator [Clostridia bacterium]|nr:LacI family DNA-binding transcriptional regulator [Clostridia bacterium]
MGITMREMGKRLGVSAVTISKALSGKPGMSEELRQRIIRLAEESGYVKPVRSAPVPVKAQAEEIAAGLDVGILIPEHFFSSDTFYAMFYKQLLKTLTEMGHFGMLELITEDMQRSLMLPNLLRSDRVQGLILLGQPEENYTARLATCGAPVVALDFHCPAVPMDAVVGDNAQGAAELTRHLIAWGHRDIGFVGNVKATSSIMERYLGFAGEMLRHDLSVRAEWILPDRDEGNALIPIALPQKLPTAFVCNCDLTARALIEQLRQRVLRVPEDISVVGYDDFNNVPGSLPLTTFRADTASMCRIAVRLLQKRFAGEDFPPCRTVVGGETIIRDSVLPIE